MGTSHRLGAVLAALMFCTTAHAADEAYTLKLHRPARAGDVFDVHLVFAQTRTRSETFAALVPETVPPALPATAFPRVPAAASAPATASAPKLATAPAVPPSAPPVVQEETIRAEITCRVEVVEVNYRGETALWITIGKFVSLPDNKEMVPAGKVIGLQDDGMDAYLSIRGGGELSEEARTVLRHVHPLEYALDEESYGSKTPRKAGESWSVNAESVAQMDSNAAYAVDPKSVQGKVTLIGAEKAGAGVPAAGGLRVGVEMTQTGKDRFRKTTGEMIDRQDATARINELLPVDGALPPLETQIVTDVTAAGTQRREDKGKAQEWQVQIKTHTEAKQTIAAVQK